MNISPTHTLLCLLVPSCVLLYFVYLQAKVVLDMVYGCEYRVRQVLSVLETRTWSSENFSDVDPNILNVFELEGKLHVYIWHAK